MPAIPREHLDHTLALARDPYRFIAKRCRRHGTDLFETRILLKPTICMTGREAAELFYDERRFLRRGAPPLRMEKTLFGSGGVQTLDGEAHRHRKQLFLRITGPDRIRPLVWEFEKQLEARAKRWTGAGAIVLYDEMQEVLARSVCAWAGVPLSEREARRRTRQLTALFDDAGAVGPAHWRARSARWRAEHWLTRLVRDIRWNRKHPPLGSAADQVPAWRDVDGRLLAPKVAAVEILNVLRPTVAVAVYLVFIALALQEYPYWCGCFQNGGHEEEEQDFVQEVRRFYPFFPAVGARVREEFEWNGYRFPAGRRVMLDLYGTNHDARLWQDPECFRPERFRSAPADAFALLPQGGGDPQTQHRCPGEAATLALMRSAAKFFATRLTYDVPRQDLRIDFSRLPALPRSRMRFANVRIVPS